MSQIAGRTHLASTARQLRRFELASPFLSVLALYAFALAWTVAARLPLLGMDGLDDAFYSEAANLWRQGRPPYIATFDVKPPGIFALLAFSQSILGPTLAALRVIAISCDAITAGALLLIGRRIGAPSVGWFAFFFYPPLSELVTANDAYCPLAAATTLAFLAALAPMAPVRRAALSGLAIGAAFTVKQTAAFEGLLLFGMLLSASDARRHRIPAAVAFIGAASLVPLAFLVYFSAVGGAGNLIGDAVFRAIVRPGSEQEGLTFLDGPQRFLGLHKSVLALIVFAAFGTLRRRQFALAAPDVRVGFLFGWLGVAMLTVVLQRAVAITYLGPELAPLLLLAGVSVAYVMPEFERVRPTWRLAALALFSVGLALFNPGNDLSPRLPARAVAQAAEAIRASGPAADDRAYVVNRGLWINIAAGLQPATRHYFPPHTLCDFATDSKDHLRDILDSRPRYIIVADRRINAACERADRWAMVDAALLRDYRRLTHAVDVIEAFDVYIRTAEEPSSPPQVRD